MASGLVRFEVAKFERTPQGMYSLEISVSISNNSTALSDFEHLMRVENSE